MLAPCQPVTLLASETVEDAVLFDASERSAISIGRRDPLPRRLSAGRWGTFCSSLFGGRSPLPLSNPHLKALRALVLALRRPTGDEEHAVAIAKGGGISRGKVDALRELLRPSPKPPGAAHG